MKDITIRQETEKDHAGIFNLIKTAFQNEMYTDHREHYLVERLRKSEAFIPELSLVAEKKGQLVGYILLSRIKIVEKEEEHESLALAPVSVLPSLRNQGIGGALIREAHAVARQLGYTSVILLGHATYYPRFGYQKASKFSIRLPFEVPEENCMAVELEKNALAGVTGTVKYPMVFFE